MASNKRPPLEIDDLTTNLKQSSGKGVDAFFPSHPVQQTEAPQEKIQNDESPFPRKEARKEITENEPNSRYLDVTTSSRHDVNLRTWKDIIENTETHNSSLRITNNEKYDIKDLIDELERKYKIKTSLNEIARLGILYIVHDFKKDKLHSLIMKVKKS